jgi:hypothetical protein
MLAFAALKKIFGETSDQNPHFRMNKNHPHEELKKFNV